MKDLFDKIASLAVAVGALSIAAVVLHREFSGPKTGMNLVAQPPSQVPNWRDLASAGKWIGDRTAPVVVVEFADFECPFCKRFHDRLAEERAKIMDSVAILFVHFPSPAHKFAMPAARAAMCASDQGVFEAFHDEVFAKQDSLGLKSWVSYAVEAGIPDTTVFKRCTAAVGPVDLIERGKIVAESLGVNVTPTVIVNGWRYSVPPLDSLGVILRAALKGRQ
jgi:protein-disulfide isomerase